MTRGVLLAIGAFVASLIGAVPPASAQTPPGNEWSHGTTLDLFGGAAVAPPNTHATFGAGFGWEINHWIEAEGTGAWLVPKDGAQAFAAELKAVASLTRPNTVVPFLSAGVGLYLATFDSTTSMPDFYQRRVAAQDAGTQQSFTDPSLVVGGGCDIFTGNHWSFRPELSVRMVMHDSDSYAVTMATVRVTYHFESHIGVR